MTSPVKNKEIGVTGKNRAEKPFFGVLDRVKYFTDYVENINLLAVPLSLLKEEYRYLGLKQRIPEIEDDNFAVNLTIEMAKGFATGRNTSLIPSKRYSKTTKKLGDVIWRSFKKDVEYGGYACIPDTLGDARIVAMPEKFKPQLLFVEIEQPENADNFQVGIDYYEMETNCTNHLAVERMRLEHIAEQLSGKKGEENKERALSKFIQQMEKEYGEENTKTILETFFPAKKHPPKHKKKTTNKTKTKNTGENNNAGKNTVADKYDIDKDRLAEFVKDMLLDSLPTEFMAGIWHTHKNGMSFLSTGDVQSLMVLNSEDPRIFTMCAEGSDGVTCKSVNPSPKSQVTIGTPLIMVKADNEEKLVDKMMELGRETSEGITSHVGTMSNQKTPKKDFYFTADALVCVTNVLPPKELRGKKDADKYPMPSFRCNRYDNDLGILYQFIGNYDTLSLNSPFNIDIPTLKKNTAENTKKSGDDEDVEKVVGSEKEYFIPFISINAENKLHCANISQKKSTLNYDQVDARVLVCVDYPENPQKFNKIEPDTNIIKTMQKTVKNKVKKVANTVLRQKIPRLNNKTRRVKNTKEKTHEKERTVSNRKHKEQEGNWNAYESKTNTSYFVEDVGNNDTIPSKPQKWYVPEDKKLVKKLSKNGINVIMLDTRLTKNTNTENYDSYLVSFTVNGDALLPVVKKYLGEKHEKTLAEQQTLPTQTRKNTHSKHAKPKTGKKTAPAKYGINGDNYLILCQYSVNMDFVPEGIEATEALFTGLVPPSTDICTITDIYGNTIASNDNIPIDVLNAINNAMKGHIGQGNNTNNSNAKKKQ